MNANAAIGDHEHLIRAGVVEDAEERRRFDRPSRLTTVFFAEARSRPYRIPKKIRVVSFLNVFRDQQNLIAESEEFYRFRRIFKMLLVV